MSLGKVTFFSLILIATVAIGNETEPEWKYQPANSEFWEEVQESLEDENYSRVVGISNEHYNEVSPDSLQAAEARLAAGIGMARLGLTYGATVQFAKLIKERIGTNIASLAVNHLEEVVQSHPVDENFISGLINDTEFSNLPSKAWDFVNFYQGMSSLSQGYHKWSKESFAKIGLDSFWDFKKKYLTAIGELARNRTDSAIERLSAIANNEKTPKSLKTKATHNLARLIFEKGDYARAYELFAQIQLNPREKGLILLERAWAKYYEKDYGKALGLLYALEAPIFDTSRSPEQYTLRMVMYNELCYYQAAFDTYKSFKRRFSPSLKAIAKRKNLAKDPQIVNMALLDHRLQGMADFFNLLRDERDIMQEYSWEDYFFTRETLSQYNLRVREMEQRLEFNLKDKVVEVANDLLFAEDQLNFLDYQTRLDSLRINRGLVNDYKPEAIPKLSFDKIYWVNGGEFWMDELEDMNVFVESRCTSGVLNL